MTRLRKRELEARIIELKANVERALTAHERLIQMLMDERQAAQATAEDLAMVHRLSVEMNDHFQAHEAQRMARVPNILDPR